MVQGLKAYAEVAFHMGKSGEDYLAEVIGMSRGSHTFRKDAAELNGYIEALKLSRGGNVMEECDTKLAADHPLQHRSMTGAAA